MVSGSDDTTVRLLDMKKLHSVAAVTGHYDASSTVGFSHNGKLVVSESYGMTNQDIAETRRHFIDHYFYP